MTDPITRLNVALEGRYRIEREIGEGGMATVYLAEDLRHERQVALKVLKPELAAMVGGERFLAEIKTTANLKHPHILPLHDSGEADGFLFYVMPFLEGESLQDRIDRDKQLPVNEAVEIARKVAGALQHAHEHGVVHRDVKPGNILFQDNEPVVTDFGIALAAGVAGGTRLTETGLSVGTPFYMSPEQATGDQGVGPATDTYALGCVLYETLVGEPPYLGNTAQAVLGKIIQGLPVSATAARKSVPANVDAAIRKALEKLPADRFTSAQDFGKALSDPGFQHGTEAGLAAAAGKGLWNPLSMVLGAVAVLSLVTAGWSLLRPDPPQPGSRFLLNVPVGVQPYTSVNGNVGLAVSPDGSQVVFVGSSEETPANQLWRRPLDQLAATPILGTEGARNPRFSPDGESVAFTRGGGLSTVSLTGAPPLAVVSDSVAGNTSGVAWGPDGMLYYRKDGPGDVWRVSASGGEQERITSVLEGEAGYMWPEALPNGRGILFTRDIGSPLEDEIAVLSLETGEIRVLLQGAMARYAHSGHIVYAGGDGTLYAAPFDQDQMEVIGPSRTLLGGVTVMGNSAAYFALSETGTLAYRPGTGGLEERVPAWFGRDGTVEVVDPDLFAAFQAPALSPDGSKVALQVDNEGAHVWVYDFDGGTFSQLTFDGENIRPFWHPDGLEVGFVRFQVSEPGVYSRRVDLSAEARLLLAGTTIREAAWTPDGRRLVFEDGGPAARTNGGVLNHSAPHPDSTSVVIEDTPALENAPALSPDGRWLAYQSGPNPNWEVYVRPFPGPGGRVPVSVGGGSVPIWTDGGREIIYQADDLRSWVVATVGTGSDFTVESLEPFGPVAEGFYMRSQTGHFDVSTLDQRIFGLTSPTGGGTLGGLRSGVQDIVVLNFFEELRQVVPD